MRKNFWGFVVVFIFVLSIPSAALAQTNCPTGQVPRLWTVFGFLSACKPDPQSAAEKSVNPSPGAASVSAQKATATGLECKNGQCTYTPLEPLPTGDLNAQNGTNFPAFVSGLFRVLISFGGLFAVVMLVVAGIGYMLSESALDIDKAKERAKAALWGLLLLTGSWLILNTINPRLLIFTLDIPRNSGQAIPLSAASPADNTPNCVDMSCLTEQQKATLQKAAALQSASGTYGALLSSEEIKQIMQDRQNIAAAEAIFCVNSGGQANYGGYFMGGCSSPSGVQDAKQNGYNNCTSMAAGGVCLTK